MIHQREHESDIGYHNANVSCRRTPEAASALTLGVRLHDASRAFAILGRKGRRDGEADDRARFNKFRFREGGDPLARAPRPASLASSTVSRNTHSSPAISTNGGSRGAYSGRSVANDDRAGERRRMWIIGEAALTR